MSYILLTSAAQDQASTRSYNEFESKDELATVVIKYYEEYLLDLEKMAVADGQINAGQENQVDNQNLEYDSNELMEFIDKFFAEMVCLERQADTPDLWIPYSTSWVKEIIYLHLRENCDGDAEIMDVEQADGIATC